MSLEERSQLSAQEVQDTLDRVLPGDREIVSLRGEEGGDRYIVQPRDRQVVAIHVGGENLADLLMLIFLDMDRTGTYLKAVRSDFELYSTLDRNPLLRLEYRADMHTRSDRALAGPRRAWCVLASARACACARPGAGQQAPRSLVYSSPSQRRAVPSVPGGLP